MMGRDSRLTQRHLVNSRFSNQPLLSKWNGYGTRGAEDGSVVEAQYMPTWRVLPSLLGGANEQTPLTPALSPIDPV